MGFLEDVKCEQELLDFYTADIEIWKRGSHGLHLQQVAKVLPALIGFYLNKTFNNKKEPSK